MKLSEPSICIPRVFPNIHQYKIKEIFQNIFGINSIDQVDIVKKTDSRGNRYNKVFVHFHMWPIEHADIREKLIDGKEIKIVYEQPWFWRCSASRSKKNIIYKPIQNFSPYIVKDKNLNNDFDLPSMDVFIKYINDKKNDDEKNLVQRQPKIRGIGSILDDNVDISLFKDHTELHNEDRKKLKRKFVSNSNSDSYFSPNDIITIYSNEPNDDDNTN